MSSPLNTLPGDRRASAPVLAFVSAGSNVQPARHIRMAVERLRERFGPLLVSGVYRSRAAGFDGDDFLNVVIGFRTSESPRSVIEALEELHEEAGRVRSANPFSPRTLDLDLLLYGDEVSADAGLPHPDIRRYSFVLGPLAEIAPRLRHPETGETMAELWRRFDKQSHPLQRLPLSFAGTAAGDNRG